MTDPHQPTWPAPQQAQQQSWPAPGQSGQAAAAQRYPAAQVPSTTPQAYPGAPQAYPGAPQAYPGAPQMGAGQPIQPWPSAPGVPVGPRLTGNTLWAWLIGALTLVQIIAYFVVDWNAVMRLNFALVAVGFGEISPADMSSYVGAVVPSLVLATAVALLCYAASVVFAFIDQRTLVRMGVANPFPWGWNFLAQPFVYLIGRTVVLSRNGRRGMGPLWLAIAGTVASWVISSIVTFSTFYTMG